LSRNIYDLGAGLGEGCADNRWWIQKISPEKRASIKLPMGRTKKDRSGHRSSRVKISLPAILHPAYGDVKLQCDITGHLCKNNQGFFAWCARDLQMLLGYSKWRNFAAVIDRAITACETAGYDPRDYFA
jgi:hypothetical protein